MPSATPSPLRAALVLSALFALSCGKKAAPGSDGTSPALETTVSSAMDTSADACTDFYQYACGAWLKTATIPADRVYWSRSFSTIIDKNEAVLRGILESAARDPGGDPITAKLGTYYGSCMDETAINAAGLAPIQPELSALDNMASLADFVTLVGQEQRAGLSTLFDVEVAPSYKDPGLNIAHVSQGGLGLPDRAYYLETDAEHQKLRDEYVAHLGRMLALSGTDASSAADQAQKILAFETDLAKASMPREDLYDSEKTWHKIDRVGLQALAPTFPWDGFFTALGYPDLTDINVATPGYFTDMPRIVAAAAPDTLRAYLRYHLVLNMAQELPTSIEDEAFAFYGKTLNGQPEMRPRWRRCLRSTEEALGEALGQAYVAKAFPGDSKAVALDMIKSIEGAFEAGLPSVAWMDDETRGRAVLKAKAVTNKIGYPDKWRDFSGLAVQPGAFYADAVAAKTFNTKFYADKIGNAVDRTEWMMTPQEVNAYYNPLNNEIVFPAGILQPPFFSATSPKAMNFGAIGMVMGHELTHGFDDDGSKFDATGKMEQWWNDEAVKRFETATQCVADQYSAYEAQPGVKLNGKLTLGENIADMGGTKLSYHAYKKWEETSGTKPPKVAGLTDDQLLFVSFAQAWCELDRPEAERVQIATDPHSPVKFRVNGPLSNLPEFAEAFDCKVGTPMHPEKACAVW